MKILFIAPRYHTNQIPIVKTLLEKGVQVYFWVLYKTTQEDHSLIKPKIMGYSFLFRIYEKIADKKIRHGLEKKFYALYAFPSPIKLFRKIHNLNPDLVIVRDINYFSLLTIAITRTLKIKTLIYTQKPLFNDFRKRSLKNILFFYFNKKYIRRITPVKGDPSKNKEKYTEFLPFVIYPQTTKPKNNKDFIKILIVARFTKRKNIILGLKAIKNLINYYPIKLTIIGTLNDNKESKEYLEEIKNFIKKNNLSNTVDIKTNIDFLSMSKEYQKHNLFILPSCNEPFSISTLEAMAHSLPVIVSDTNGSQYEIKDNVNGFIFETNNEHDLTNKIEKIIQNKNELAKMGEESYKLIKQNNSPEKYYTHLLKILTSLEK